MVSNYQGMLYLRMSVTVLDLQHRFFLHGRVQGYYSCVTWPRFHPHRTPSIWTMMTNRPNFHQLNYRQWYKLIFFYIKKKPTKDKKVKNVVPTRTNNLKTLLHFIWTSRTIFSTLWWRRIRTHTCTCFHSISTGTRTWRPAHPIGPVTVD